MKSPFDSLDALKTFTGRAPLFPLPNVVTFPHVLQPLHIFEPRYREMTADALDGERLIAMALMKPGWETLREDRIPEIYDTVCLGRITAEQRLPDGRYFLLLQGLIRARVISEAACDLPYRVGQFDLCADQYSAEPIIDRDHRRTELLSGFRELFPHIDLDHVFMTASDEPIPLGALCDVITDALNLQTSDSQQVLTELDVDLRSDLVLNALRESCRNHSEQPIVDDFPPRFSLN